MLNWWNSSWADQEKNVSQRLARQVRGKNLGPKSKLFLATFSLTDGSLSLSLSLSLALPPDENKSCTPTKTSAAAAASGRIGWTESLAGGVVRPRPWYRWRMGQTEGGAREGL